MAKILIALSGAENTGKTSTLLYLIEKLEEKFGIQPTTLLIQGKDKVVIFLKCTGMLFFRLFQYVNYPLSTDYEQQNLIFYVTSITVHQKNHLLINTPSIFC